MKEAEYMTFKEPFKLLLPLTLSVVWKKDDSLIGAAQRNVLRDRLSISVTDPVGFERWSGNTQGNA